LLQDFFGEVFEQHLRSTQPWGANIDARATSNCIVLIDDRQNHPNCEKKIERNCQTCKIFSRNLTIPQLRDRLLQEVSLISIPTFKSY
jgi:hypothetical protein